MPQLLVVRLRELLWYETARTSREDFLEASDSSGHLALLCRDLLCSVACSDEFAFLDLSAHCISIGPWFVFSRRKDGRSVEVL